MELSDQLTLREIYAGKPDAYDEMRYSTQTFDDNANIYLFPYELDIERLLSKDYFFINGYKGTGKTALLFHLDSLIRERNEQCCTSFIFFKEEFSDLNRTDINNLSCRLCSALSFEQDNLAENNDFEYIWKWLLLSKIANDNISFNNSLFIEDDRWSKFRNILKSISSPLNDQRFFIPRKLTISPPIFDSKIEIDINQKNEVEKLKLFHKAIDMAEAAFTNLTRTNIPYYLFIDELEAYYGDNIIFKRDLRILRDLIITVKKINHKFSNENTKIICSVRTEILNAIDRHIVSKELNKIISGFEVIMKWDYNTNKSYKHPIMRILLKRIMIEEEKRGINTSFKATYEKWFPDRIRNIEPSHYILNNSWNKPRDIVYFLNAVQTLGTQETRFSQYIFDESQKTYSWSCLKEIMEEMRALYTPEETNVLERCLRGYKTTLTYEEFLGRINSVDKKDYFQNRITQVLEDLYRVGVLGNYSNLSGSYRWQHKGEDGVIISDEWAFIVHPALHKALSINSRHDRGIEQNESLGSQFKKGDIVTVRVFKIVANRAFVTIINRETNIAKGSIHISQISDDYVKNINDYVSINCTLEARVLQYNSHHRSWDLGVCK